MACGCYVIGFYVIGFYVIGLYVIGYCFTRYMVCCNCKVVTGHDGCAKVKQCFLHVSEG